MQEYKFEPYIGKNYTSSNNYLGKRILLLGESHYGYDDVPAEEAKYATKEIITGQISNDEKKHSYHSKIKRIFNYSLFPNLDKESFWNSVSFYTFIQTNNNLKAARQRPSDWESSIPLFFNALIELEPDLIFVLGKTLWFKLPDNYENISGEHGPFPYSWIFRIPNKKQMLATYINHPSSFGFNYEMASKQLEKLFYADLIKV